MKIASMLFVMAGFLTAANLHAQDRVKDRLEKSPRHLEWVKVPQGDRTVQSFIAFPEVQEKATAVIVIHEICGLSDWVCGVADRLAAAGYIAIAPNLLSGTAPTAAARPTLAVATRCGKQSPRYRPTRSPPT